MQASIVSQRYIGVGLVAATVLLAAIVAFVPMVGVGVAAGVLALLVAAYFAARPWQLLGLFIFLLPPHVVLMAVLLVQVGLPRGVVKAISAWKEAALLLLLALAAWRALRGRWTPKLPDVLVLLYLLIVGLSVAFYLPETPSRSALVYGARDTLLPVLLYGVGRFFPLSEGRARSVFRWLVWAALIFSVIGVVERLFIPTIWHVRLGIPRYFQELLNLYYPGHLFGLPENYWTSSNSGQLRRAVSIYGSSQPFALSFLMLLPVTFYAVINRQLAEHRMARWALAFSLLALVLTITRYTIVVCLLLLVFAALIYNQQARKLAGAIVVAVGIAGGLLLLTSSSVQLLFVNTLTFEDTSSNLRLIIWRETAETIAAQPLGYGIGRVGQTANRFLGGPRGGVVVIEGQYSKVGVELGIPGLLTYGAILVTVGFALLRLAGVASTPYLKGVCFSMGLTFIGLALNSVTTEWHNSTSLVYPTFWLAGACLASLPGAGGGTPTPVRSSPENTPLLPSEAV